MFAISVNIDDYQYFKKLASVINIKGRYLLYFFKDMADSYYYRVYSIYKKGIRYILIN